MASSQEDGIEARFSHILQPIKDLTKNWDIDIAACLEDYLEALEHTTISFDGGTTTMNFAEAAMLVQSSACVYSKKVDYLHSLVFQVLEMLANKKKQAQKSSADDEENDADADNHNNNDDEQFLSLDDIPEGKNLNLKEDFDSREEFQLLPEMPLCLIPIEEGDKGENPLLSKTGEVLASRNDFKMNTCCIHSGGTLLLDMSHLRMLEESFRIQAALRDHPQGSPLAEGTEMRNDAVEDMPENILQGGDSFHDDEHMADDDDAAPPLDISVNQPMETNDVTVGQDGNHRSERNKQKKPVDAMYTATPYVDPWKMLEQFEETKTGKPRSNKGTIHKLCPGTEDQTKKRKRKEKQPAPPESLKQYLENTLYLNAHKYPKNRLKVTTFPEFDRIFWEEYKRRQSLQREIQKKQHKAVEIQDMVEEGEAEENEDVLPQSEVGDADNEVGNDDNADNDDFRGDNLLNVIDDAVQSHNDFINDHTEKSWAERIDEGVIVSSYEDLVRKHVEEYLDSAQKYAQITELSKRVGEWEDKVLPRLEEEESHRPFDINEYSSSVIDSLPKGCNVKFRDVVRGQPEFEICRTFLASLMLANTTNVKIKEKGSLEDGMDSFELKLLSTVRHFEQLQEYMAPSLSQKH